MEVLRRGAFISVLLLVVACAREPTAFEYTEANNAVHAVLTAGSQVASVLITRFHPGTRETRRLSGARVHLIHGTDTLRLVELPTDPDQSLAVSGTPPPTAPGHYTARVPGGVHAGERYELFVQFPDGGTARGAAVVPHAPRIVAPGTDTRIPVRNNGKPDRDSTGGTTVLRPVIEIPVRWHPPSGVGRVELALGVDAVYRGGTRVSGAGCTLRTPVGFDVGMQDSSTVRVYEMACTEGNVPVRWDSVIARLAVTAYDTAYARYAKEVLEGTSVRWSHSSAGLTGARGVFAGSASAERRLILVHDDPYAK
jgi:hypothetical protein